MKLSIPNLKKIAKKISDGLDKIKDTIVRHAENLEATVAIAALDFIGIPTTERSTEAAGAGNPISEPLAKGLAAVEKKFNKAVSSPTLPRSLVNIYLRDAAHAMAMIHDTPISEDWAEKKAKLAAKYGELHEDPNYFMGGQYEELIFDGIEMGATSQSKSHGKAISMVGLLVVGYELYFPDDVYSPYYSVVKRRKRPYLGAIGYNLNKAGTILTNTEQAEDGYPYFGMTASGADRAEKWVADFLTKFHKELTIGQQFALVE